MFNLNNILLTQEQLNFIFQHMPMQSEVEYVGDDQRIQAIASSIAVVSLLAEQLNFFRQGIDSMQSEDKVEYIGDDQRIRQAIESLCLYQGRVSRADIDQAIDACIESFEMSIHLEKPEEQQLTYLEQFENAKNWIRANGQLIGRLWLFAEEHENQGELLDELIESYDLRRQAYMKGTIERLVENTLLGTLLSVVSD